MALAVASTSTASANGASSMVVTAPSGIATGDLLVMIVSHSQAVSLATSTGFIQRLRRDEIGGSADAHNSLSILTKVAVLADESASNYTVTANDSGAVTMFRVTGYTGTGDPLTSSSSFSFNTPADTYTGGGTGELSLTRSNDNLMIMAVSSGIDDSAVTMAHSDYTAVSGVANPTWTEVTDIEYNPNGSASNSFAVAYTITTSPTPVTSYSYVFSQTLDSDRWSYVHALANISNPQHTPGTNTFFAVKPVSFINATTLGSAGTAELIEVKPTFFANTVKTTSNTVFTNRAKPSTAWTNQTKP